MSRGPSSPKEVSEVYPEDLRYSKEHEWVRQEGGNRVRVGITFYAQRELGDVVFVELPRLGDEVEANRPCAVVESVKSVSDVYAPVSGTVVEINETLPDKPELINQSPYEDGWLFVIEMSRPQELEELLDAEGYKAHIGEP